MILKLILIAIIAYAIYNIYKTIDFRKLFFYYQMRKKYKPDYRGVILLCLTLVGLNQLYRNIGLIKKLLKALINDGTEEDVESILNKINNLSYLLKYYKVLIRAIFAQINSFTIKGYIRSTLIYSKQVMDLYYLTGYFYKKMDQKFKNIIHTINQLQGL